jgi:hypothetical protein
MLCGAKERKSRKKPESLKRHDPVVLKDATENAPIAPNAPNVDRYDSVYLPNLPKPTNDCDVCCVVLDKRK